MPVFHYFAQAGLQDIPVAVCGLLGTLLIVRPPALFDPLANFLPIPDPAEDLGMHTTKGPRWVGICLQIGALGGVGLRVYGVSGRAAQRRMGRVTPTRSLRSYY